uniref:Uncharacterized protein n=1 Tax=Sipha flava TaxID=143950 RepID=A0A2S2Q7R0_9HEMI
MPEDGTLLKYEGWGKTCPHSIVIYANFEALLEKCSEVQGKNTTITHIRVHRPMSYRYYVKAADYVTIDLLEKHEIPRKPVIYHGSETREDVAKRFLEEVVSIGTRVRDLLKINVEIIMSDEEERVHSACVKCNLCRENYRC